MEKKDSSSENPTQEQMEEMGSIQDREAGRYRGCSVQTPRRKARSGRTICATKQKLETETSRSVLRSEVTKARGRTRHADE